VFCLVVGEVLRRVLAHPDVAGVGSIHWLYIDDWIVQLPLAAAIAMLEVVDVSADESNLPHTAEEVWLPRPRSPWHPCV
jgi:hypothetical protein